MNSRWMAAMVMALVAGQVQAINKCVNEFGRPVFQDVPCPAGRGGEIDVRPAAGRAAPPAPVASGAPPRQTEAQRIEAQIAQSQRERRLRDLRERIVPGADQDLRQHRAACKERLGDLDRRRYEYVQNLYGKTHAAQMASEKAATAAMCDTRDRELKEQLDTVRSECRHLGGCD